MLSIPNQYRKVRIHQQYNVLLHLTGIHLNRFRLRILYRVLQESWLNHYQTVGHRFPHQTGSLVDRLIRRTSEWINYPTSSQVVHVLREMLHWGWKTETIRIPFAIDAEPNTEFQQSSINPFLHLCWFFYLSLLRSYSGHHHDCCLFIKSPH